MLSIREIPGVKVNTLYHAFELIWKPFEFIYSKILSMEMTTLFKIVLIKKKILSGDVCQVYFAWKAWKWETADS